MSSGGATTKGGPVKGVHHNNPPSSTTTTNSNTTAVNNNTTNNSNNKKSNKSDSNKSDKLDLNPKIQATAEQMQIAKIMDSHRAEDPELQKKIRQVMEITRTTEDQACMALHSREYDIEQAITLLTDGGSQSLESEWACAGKKRKGKNPNQKSDSATASKDGKGSIKDGIGRDKLDRDLKGGEKKDLEGSDQTFIFGGDQRRGGDRGGRGGGIRGRGGRPGGPLGGRGGGRSDKENEEMMKLGRMPNGPGGGVGMGMGRGGTRGGGGVGFGGRGSRGGGRTFASRARGDRDGGDSYNTIDVWENSQADGTKETPMKVEKWGEFPSADDWDNDEYTGSLNDTKVFTPSSQTADRPLNDTTNGPPNSNLHGSQQQSASNNNSSAADVLKMNQEAGVTMSSVVQGLTGGSGALNGGGNVQTPLDLNMLLSKQNASGGPTGGVVSSHANPGVNLLASLQSSYSNQMSNVGGVSNNQVNMPPLRNKVQRPRGPPSKIPSSAVEMPDDPATKLDVQFGGLDLSGSDSSSGLTFSSVMQGGKQQQSSVDNNSLIYGGGQQQNSKLDSSSSYVSNNDKDLKSFQSSINSQSQQQQQQEPGKGGGNNSLLSNSSSNIVPGGIDTLTSLTQHNQQTKPQQQTGSSSYGAGNNSGSAFVSYAHAGKPAPGFSAPGFPPVSQNMAGTYSSSNNATQQQQQQALSYGSQQQQQPIPNQQQQQSGGYLAYGTQPSNLSSQPIVASSQNANVPYGSTAPPQNAYHMNTNVNSGYNNSSANAQYASYGPKMGGLNAAKESTTDVSANNIPVSSTGSGTSAQMGSTMQPGSGEEWNYGGTELPTGNTTSSASSNAKSSAPSANNTTTNAASKMMPPGMVMPPYILSQNTPTVPFYGVQTQVYGYEDNSMQFVPRLPPNFGYYDATGPQGYGVPVAQSVSGRNDGGPAMQAYSNAADGRFQRSDSSTASPVPSNLTGGNTQQAMYNQAMPYFYVGNNMVQGSHFPYPHMYQPPMAQASNTSGPAVNHQYQNKSVYNTPYAYDTNQGGGQTNDFSKGSYNPSGGPNSNTPKGSSGSTSGVSQSTDLNSSIYKGHGMGKINSSQFGPGGQGGFSSGAQPNLLNNTNAMATSYSVFIPQADASNASRPGQPKGKQQYGGTPYWGNN